MQVVAVAARGPDPAPPDRPHRLQPRAARALVARRRARPRGPRRTGLRGLPGGSRRATCPRSPSARSSSSPRTPRSSAPRRPCSSRRPIGAHLLGDLIFRSWSAGHAVRARPAGGGDRRELALPRPDPGAADGRGAPRLEAGVGDRAPGASRSDDLAPEPRPAPPAHRRRPSAGRGRQAGDGAADPRPRPLPGRERHARARAGRRRADRDRRQAEARASARPTWSRAWRGTASACCCRTSHPAPTRRPRPPRRSWRRSAARSTWRARR